MENQQRHSQSWRRLIGCHGSALTGARVVGFVKIKHGGKVAALESLLVLLSSLRVANPAGQVFGCHGIAAENGWIVGTAVDKALRVVAVALLFSVVRQFRAKPLGWGRFSMTRCSTISGNAKATCRFATAPPQSRSRLSLAPLRSDDGSYIGNKVRHGIGRHTFRLVALL